MSVRTVIKTIERGIRYANKPSETEALEPLMQAKQQLNSFLRHSEGEKNDLNRLNDRMAIYVNRVKSLEHENYKLLKELQELQGHWGDDTRIIKQQYENDLYDLRSRIDDSANQRANADIRAKRTAYENGQLQERYEDIARLREHDRYKTLSLEHELEQTNSSLHTLTKTIQDEEHDIQKYRLQRDDLNGRVGEIMDRLDDEVLRRVSIEYNNQTLREHIEFLRQIHAKETLEMSHLTSALPFNDQIEFYKDQLKRVVTNIRKDYEQLHQDQTREMQEWMRTKTEEIAHMHRQRDPLHDLELDIHAENHENLRSSYGSSINEMDDLRKQNDVLEKRLNELEDRLAFEKRRINQRLEEQHSEYDKANEDLNNLLNDYNHLNSNKASLEYEIQVYKRLLDSQLNRLGAAAPPVDVDPSSTVSSGAFGGKVSNKREKKGSIGISDATPDGKCITIENASSGNNNVVADLGGWLLKRRVDNGTEITYKIPAGVFIVPGNSLKIWSGSYFRQRSGNDLINADVDNWGIGISSVTKLLNPNSEEKSSFIQNITFANY